MSWFQSAKLELASTLGLSKDALHIYVGLGIFFLATILSRRRFESPIPRLLVVLAAVLGELWDRHDDIETVGRWHWWASFHDLWNTLFWPTVILTVGRLNLLRKRTGR
jgi:hypothetical protein